MQTLSVAGWNTWWNTDLISTAEPSNARWRVFESYKLTRWAEIWHRDDKFIQNITISADTLYVDNSYGYKRIGM